MEKIPRGGAYGLLIDTVNKIIDRINDIDKNIIKTTQVRHGRFTFTKNVDCENCDKTKELQVKIEELELKNADLELHDVLIDSFNRFHNKSEDCKSYSPYAPPLSLMSRLNMKSSLIKKLKESKDLKERRDLAFKIEMIQMVEDNERMKEHIKALQDDLDKKESLIREKDIEIKELEVENNRKW